MNEKLKRLYLNARKHFDLPDFEQFSVDMQDPNKMAKLRENMILHYDMPSLDQMYQDFGVKKKTFLSLRVPHWEVVLRTLKRLLKIG